VFASGTEEIQSAHLNHVTADGKSYDVYLIDTPGFDDTEMQTQMSSLPLWIG